MIALFINANAQDTIRLNIKIPKIVVVKTPDTTTNNIRDIQITYFYPLGTNGLYSYKYTNRFSINLIAGLNGGVDGLEFGGIMNINNGNVKGFQIAGIGNLTKGDVFGTQIGGIFNINSGFTEGVMLTSHFNINAGDFKGVQISGIFNTNFARFEGAAISGIFNFNRLAGDGFQGAGICNLNSSNFKGVQVAGILNSNTGFFSNEPSELVQIGGVLNINTSKIDGAQISSCLNVNTDTMKGVQVGLVNFARQLDGVQVGLFNVCGGDSSKVVPIGLLSIVKNGLHQIEISGNDLMYGNLNIKLGVNAFYSIFKFGFTVYKSNYLYSSGLGIGTSVRITDKSRIHFEVSSSHITDFKTYSFNMLSKADLFFQYKFAKHFAINFGPSYNSLMSYRRNTEIQPIIEPLYSFYNFNSRSYSIKDWVGANVGFVFTF